MHLIDSALSRFYFVLVNENNRVEIHNAPSSPQGKAVGVSNAPWIS
nr:MAG TPA: hypothetical protein [Caudoviricetes sp.]